MLFTYFPPPLIISTWWLGVATNPIKISAIFHPRLSLSRKGKRRPACCTFKILSLFFAKLLLFCAQLLSFTEVTAAAGECGGTRFMSLFEFVCVFFGTDLFLLFTVYRNYCFFFALLERARAHFCSALALSLSVVQVIIHKRSLRSSCFTIAKT